MLVNKHTAIIGPSVVLVPYRREHVPTYHKWMLDEELRDLTASDALTLDEEYEMQRKWQTDADKLTFIILARPNTDAIARHLTQEEITALPMIGDVNLFLKGTPEEDDEEVEAEVMIAENEYRRKGFALSALHLLFHYATSSEGPASLRLPPTRLVARIGENNVASQRLFEKMGFAITKRVPVFQEVELRYRGGGEWTGGTVVEFE